MTNFNSEPAKEASAPTVAATANISNTALEKKMQEQMTKGVVIDSVVSSLNATDSNTLTASETTLQKSPPNRINNA